MVELLLSVIKCKKCGLPNGARGMIEDGQYISDVCYYNGQGTEKAKPIQIKLNESGICNVCERK